MTSYEERFRYSQDQRDPRLPPPLTDGPSQHSHNNQSYNHNHNQDNQSYSHRHRHNHSNQSFSHNQSHDNHPYSSQQSNQSYNSQRSNQSYSSQHSHSNQSYSQIQSHSQSANSYSNLVDLLIDEETQQIGKITPTDPRTLTKEQRNVLLEKRLKQLQDNEETIAEIKQQINTSRARKAAEKEINSQRSRDSYRFEPPPSNLHERYSRGSAVTTAPPYPPDTGYDTISPGSLIPNTADTDLNRYMKQNSDVQQRDGSRHRRTSVLDKAEKLLQERKSKGLDSPREEDEYIKYPKRGDDFRDSEDEHYGDKGRYRYRDTGNDDNRVVLGETYRIKDQRDRDNRDDFNNNRGRDVYNEKRRDDRDNRNKPRDDYNRRGRDEYRRPPRRRRRGHRKQRSPSPPSDTEYTEVPETLDSGDDTASTVTYSNFRASRRSYVPSSIQVSAQETHAILRLF